MLRGRKSTREPDLDHTSGGIVDIIICHLLSISWLSIEIFYFSKERRNEIKERNT